MPVSAAETSTMAENNRYRKPKNQPMLDTDPSTLKMPSTIQSTRCKATISPVILSNPTENNTPKKKNFSSATFRGLGCAASAQVSVPGVIKTSADWDAKKVKKKKQRSLQEKKSTGPFKGVAMVHGNSLVTSSSCVVDPDVWCGPGIGFGSDAAASVDCVVSRRPVSGRGKVDGVKMNHRERSSFGGRRTVNHEAISFCDAEPDPGMSRPRLDVFNSRRQRHVRHPSPEGLAEIVMLQSSLLMGGRPNRLDRYRDLRLDVDNMSYEELLDLGDRIGYVSTGLREDEIVRSLRKTKLSPLDELSEDIPTDRKCSICQEEYTADDEMGKLECGHSYHMQCIKNWLVKKNACPICKTAVASQQ
ncbi:putative A-agglutinin anchorage subunit-like [Heracleum sosnowskyi]|uniref:RING-type E3 ubiquitin transferase n=1 Tax=Heracleum sosnowskyi TaxID=360622 RepID=A0AAD8HSQ1_9APIA|nr:putative A-agglutinin anchorage subunit-like [Heracleum sosnowskyi]